MSERIGYCQCFVKVVPACCEGGRWQVASFGRFGDVVCGNEWSTGGPGMVLSLRRERITTESGDHGFSSSLWLAMGPVYTRAVSPQVHGVLYRKFDDPVLADDGSSGELAWESGVAAT